MSLEEIYFIGQTIAVLLVLGSLYAVWLQLRQANRIARAQMTAESLAAGAALMVDLAQNDALAAIGAKARAGSEPLSAVEAERWEAFLDGALLLLENQYLAAQDGLMKEAALRRMETLSRWLLADSHGRAHWDKQRKRFAPAFREHVDATLAGAPAPAKP